MYTQTQLSEYSRGIQWYLQITSRLKQEGVHYFITHYRKSSNTSPHPRYCCYACQSVHSHMAHTITADDLRLRILQWVPKFQTEVDKSRLLIFS